MKDLQEVAVPKTTPFTQIQVKRRLHCITDLNILKRMGASKATGIKTQESVIFYKYQCPKCQKKYTSLQGVPDQRIVPLDNVDYINIDLYYDVLRCRRYYHKPHPLLPRSRCYVYGVSKQKICKNCHSTKLENIKIQYITKSKKTAVYNTKYCERCDIHFIDYKTYSEHRNSWVILNQDELLSIKEGVEKKAIQKKERKAARKAEAQRHQEELQKRQQEQKKIERERLEAERIERERQKQFEREQNKVAEKKTKKILEVIHEHDNNIRVKDFVVRRTTFKCRHNDHKLQNINAVIGIIDRNGEVKQTTIPAGYCPNCNVFFIMESTYQNLKLKGTPICRVSDEKAYLSNSTFANGMQLAQESVLKQYGYSVSQQDDLTSARRRKILALLVDNKILTRSDIISYLDFFISQKKYDNKFGKAIDKWESDREFISEYKAGDYTNYGVGGIYRRQ